MSPGSMRVASSNAAGSMRSTPPSAPSSNHGNVDSRCSGEVLAGNAALPTCRPLELTASYRKKIWGTDG